MALYGIVAAAVGVIVYQLFTKGQGKKKPGNAFVWICTALVALVLLSLASLLLKPIAFEAAAAVGGPVGGMWTPEQANKYFAIVIVTLGLLVYLIVVAVKLCRDFFQKAVT